ncbi:MAG TPA: TetR/AcrR family transcriptional regulator [Polyangia bacterium]|nr:TetR/AcrR family transcriptional regulator [Polyangia bacterium]
MRERFKETTLQAVLAAAEEVFADAGLHAAHMGEIAERAGVAVGTLYNHFADREALLAGLAEARFKELLANIDGALKASADRPFRERARALVVAMLNYYERHQKFMRIFLQGETGRYERTFPTISGAMKHKMTEIGARVEKLIDQGVREKAVRSDYSDLAPFFLIGMMRALVMRHVIHGRGDGMAVEADRLLTAFLSGVGT